MIVHAIAAALLVGLGLSPTATPAPIATSAAPTSAPASTESPAAPSTPSPAMVDRARAELNAGIAAFKRADYTTAFAKFSAAIDDDPGYAVAYTWRGDTLDDQGHPDKAVTDYDTAIRLDPEYEYAHATRCDTLRELKRYAEAAQDCDKAIALDPLDAYAVRMLGRVWLDQSQYAKAIVEFKKAIAIDNGYAAAYASLCDAYRQDGQYKLALPNCDVALKQNPGNDDARFYRAVVRYHLNDYAASVDDWTVYIDHNGTDDNAHYNRGRAIVGRADAGGPTAAADYKRALADFEFYVKANPRDPDGLLWRGRVEKDLGLTKSARADLTAAGHLYRVAGDTEGAAQAAKFLAQLGAAPAH